MKNNSRIKAGKRTGNPSYRTSSICRADFKFKANKQPKKNPLK